VGARRPQNDRDGRVDVGPPGRVDRDRPDALAAANPRADLLAAEH
jgi:hypothetical protein